MRHIVASLRRHHFFSLSGGILAANVLSILTMPILTRLYGLEAFGIFAIFWALSTLIGTFSSLRLEQSLPILKDADESLKVARTAWWLALTTAVVFLALWIFSPLPNVIKSAPSTLGFGLAVAVMCLGQALTQIQIQLSIQTGQMRALSLRHLVEKLTSVIASMALAHMGYNGLIFAQILGSTISMGMLAGFLKKNVFGFISPKDAFHLLKKYGDYPVKNGAAAMFTILTAQLPPLIYSLLFPVQMLGLYNLAQRLIEAPNTVVGSAVSVVYYRRMLTADPAEMKAIFLRALKWTALALFVPMLVVGLFAHPIMARFFGAQWEPSAIYLVMLLPLGFFRMLFMTGQSLFLVLRKLHLDLTVTAVVFFAQISGLGLGYYLFSSLEGSVFVASVFTALAYVKGLALLLFSLKTGAQEIQNAAKAEIGQQTL